MKAIANTMGIDWRNKSHVCYLAALYGPNYFVIKHKGSPDYWTVNYEEIDLVLEQGAEIVFRTGDSQVALDKKIARYKNKLKMRDKVREYLRNSRQPQQISEVG